MISRRKQWKTWFNDDFVITLHISKKYLSAAVFVLLSALYVAWELYWYKRISYNFVKWHTHFAFIAIPFSILGVMVYVAFVGELKAYRTKALLAISSVSIALLVLEASALVVAGIHNFPNYSTQYQLNAKNIYHVWPADSIHRLTQEEFDYIRHTNSLGFSDGEWTKTKDPKICRILSLGDSFTEGDGAPQDSAYPVLLKNILQEDCRDIEVLNAGICGSDPYFNFKNLNDRLVDFHPDIVVQTLSSDDIMYDIHHRGGMERFKQNGTVAVKSQGYLLPFYECSYVFRLVAETVDYFRKKSEGYSQETSGEITGLIKQYQKLAEAHHFKMIWVLLPTQDETADRQLKYDFLTLKENIKNITGTPPVDLITLYQTYTSHQKKPLCSYYWPQNRHHNAKGYHMMAEVIADRVRKYLLPASL